MATRSDLLLAFYGDDFTGSTDAMEALALSGLRTVLFLSPPKPELVQQKFPDLRCIGVTGWRDMVGCRSSRKISSPAAAK